MFNQHRIPVSEDTIEEGLAILVGTLRRRLEQHGRNTFVSHHEVLGIIQEEMLELEQAVRGRDDNDKDNELLDVAVAALFGWISSREYNKRLH